MALSGHGPEEKHWMLSPKMSRERNELLQEETVRALK